MDFLNGWRFDIRTAIITVIVVPLSIFLLKIILKYLKHWGSYLLEGGMYWLSRLIKHSLAGALTLKRFCRLQLADWNQYLHVPSSLDIKLDVDRVYVPLILESQGGEQSNYTHTDILTAGNRIRVIGDPGSGKSSLIKRLFRDSCRRAIESPLKSQIPLFLELKNLDIPAEVKDDILGDWFYKKLRADAEKSAVYQMGECFDNYAETAGLLVLLDGLDEVSTTQYSRVQKAINGLSAKLSHLSERNTIVLTMRAQFHQQIKEAFRDSFAQALFLKPFSPSDIYEFLTRWPFKSNSDQIIPRVYKDLTDRPTLREMCSNPLILAMYVAEDQAAGSILAPESRTEFYSKVTEELIIRRRLQQTGPAIAATKLREQRERILGKLAYNHLLNPDQPTNSLQWLDAMEVVKEIMDCNEYQAETIFREIAKETGLVTEERHQQSIRFIHLTFCEFLAAFEAVQGQSDGWLRLVETQNNFKSEAQPQLQSRLIEVIPFACALLPRIKRYDALSDVNRLGDSRLLARSFLETKLYDHPSWPDFINSEKHLILTTPEEFWDERWLRRLHLFNVVVRDANNCASRLPTSESGIDLPEFFQSLVTKQRSNLSILLSAYASQDAAAAFRLAEVCNLDLVLDFPEIIVTHCDQIPFLALVRDQASREPERIKIWVSLLTEAALRSRVVAQSLHLLEPSEKLESYYQKAPRRMRWMARWLFSKSYYTQIVSIAVWAKDIPIATLPMLDLLRKIPAPGCRLLLDKLSVILIMIISIVIYCLFFMLRIMMFGIIPTYVIIFI